MGKQKVKCNWQRKKKKNIQNTPSSAMRRRELRGRKTEVTAVIHTHIQTHTPIHPDILPQSDCDSSSLLKVLLGSRMCVRAVYTRTFATATISVTRLSLITKHTFEHTIFSSAQTPFGCLNLRVWIFLSFERSPFTSFPAKFSHSTRPLIGYHWKAATILTARDRERMLVLISAQNKKNLSEKWFKHLVVFVEYVCVCVCAIE